MPLVVAMFRVENERMIRTLKTYAEANPTLSPNSVGGNGVVAPADGVAGNVSWRMTRWWLGRRYPRRRAARDKGVRPPGAGAILLEHGFAKTTTYELDWEMRRYPPKAILGTAYEFATGERLASHDFAGAVRVLGQLGSTPRRSGPPE
jgi:hypothetical protein